MNLKAKIIHLLGGITNKELLEKTQAQADHHKLIVDDLQIFVDFLTKQSTQLDMWFMAFTNAIHNFNKSITDNKFNEITSQRIREVATTYRMLSCYSLPYQIIEDELFKELQDFIFIELDEVFSTGNFLDESYNKFNELKSKINPFVDVKINQKR